MLNKHKEKIQKQKQSHLFKAQLVAAQIAVKYGARHNGKIELTNDRIREFWVYDEPYPSNGTLTQIKNLTIKEIIKKHIDLKGEIWNSDFLHGLSNNFDIIWDNKAYPTMEFSDNDDLVEIIKTSNIGGTYIESEKSEKIKKWINIPALYTTYDKNTINYIAGLLAGGKRYDMNEFSYASYNPKTIEAFKEIGIPIEYSDAFRLLISPIWIALFTDHMPIEIRSKWLNLKKPYEAENYAAILWRTYIGDNFSPKRIPYLKCRRTIFIKYGDDELGAMKKLEILRLNKKLTGLHNSIRDIIREWEKKTKK